MSLCEMSLWSQGRVGQFILITMPRISRAKFNWIQTLITTQLGSNSDKVHAESSSGEASGRWWPNNKWSVKYQQYCGMSYLKLWILKLLIRMRRIELHFYLFILHHAISNCYAMHTTWIKITNEEIFERIWSTYSENCHVWNHFNLHVNGC
jgi:hypothetical protein